MIFEKYAHQFAVKAEMAGFSAENTRRCLDYAKPLVQRNLPVIYNSSHFAALVGYQEFYMARAIVFTSFFYREFYIRKKNGELRILHEPLPSLKEIQTWILNNILYRLPVSKFAKAYLKNTTLKQNLVFHRDQQKVVCLDILDFFGSIRRSRVERILRHQGYSLQLSNLISKLCCYLESLPQGAPTSPQLSNLIMKEFDDVISKFCLSKNIRYSRYADDLTFSGDFDHIPLISFVQQELKKFSMTLNTRKTRVMSKNQRQTVTGIVVNEKLQVTKKKRDKIRQAMFYIQKYGLENHLDRVGELRSNFLNHLLGQILFILFINPEDQEFVNYKTIVNKLLDTHKNL